MTAYTLPYRQLLGHGRVDEALLLETANRLAPLHRDIRENPSPDMRAIFSLAGRADDLPVLTRIGSFWRKNYTDLVVIGSGGSGLSGKALGILATGQATTNHHSLHVLDNADPFAFAHVLETLDLDRTCFLAVSKSGGTAEACMQAALALRELEKRGAGTLGDRFTVITMPGDSPLRQLGARCGATLIDHDPHLGGRFSILSAVGILPALFMGLDAAALRRGAEEALKANTECDPAECPAALGAALNLAHMREGRHVAVLMTYAEQLWGLALWWRQGWAESLGKNGMGSTPVAALGPADQHSQLQLWLDGPEGKLYTLLLPGTEGKGEKVSGMPQPMDYLNGRSLGDLVAAQSRATAETLIRHERPLRIFEVDTVDERAMGALVMHFTLEILFTGALLGVNPFGQPAVEESKRLTHEYLTRKRA